MFSEEPEEVEKEERENKNIYKPVEPLKLTHQQQDVEANLGNDEDAPEVQEDEQMAEDEPFTKLVVQEGERTISAHAQHSPLTPEHLPADGQSKTVKQLPRPVYWSIISVMVAVASIVIGMNGELVLLTFISNFLLFSVPRVKIILIAQVFNGCLLPVFSICLLLCLNDPQFMSAAPQKKWANVFLFLSVSITLFLSSNVFIQKIFGHLMSGVQTKLCIAGSVAGQRNYS